MEIFNDASLIEMIFVYGTVLGLALWQLISVRRLLAKGDGGGERATDREGSAADTSRRQ